MPVYSSNSPDRPFSVVPQSLVTAAPGSLDGLAAINEADALSAGEVSEAFALQDVESFDERLRYVEAILKREAAHKRAMQKPRELDPRHAALQEFVDSLFEWRNDEELRRLDIIVMAETFGLPDELFDLVTLLPPGTYGRDRLCTQLNSVMNAQRLNQRYDSVQ